ncbi:response regulator transcription factor [Aureivirga sp. CE67]|uniref:response regulator transcription factor n=1 Tax=Aureivirga sp. CE67 TaxID=1788983 RepID=UPI0018C91B90|nr:response regulator transcription factor [Aureivirga sp. CE67]
MKVRVVIIEDNEILLESYESIINSDKRFEVVGKFICFESAFPKIKELETQIVLSDIELPKVNGIDGVRILKKNFPKLLIILISVHENSNFIFDALRFGAIGYLNKNTSPEKLIEALVDAKSGGSPMSSSIARKVVNSFRAPLINELSKRESDVLRLLAKGKTSKSIANELNISINTIKTHTRNIYEKLQVNSKDDLIDKYANY